MSLPAAELTIDLKTAGIAKFVFDLFHNKLSGTATFQQGQTTQPVVFRAGIPLNTTDQQLKALFAFFEGRATFKSSAMAQPGEPSKSFLRAYLDGVTAFYNEARLKACFPESQPANFICFDRDVFYQYDKGPLLPEERGIATIASSAETIADVFAQSLLLPLQKQQNLFKLFLLKILTLETPAERDDRLLEAGLTPQQKELKQQAETLMKRELHRTNYFELLGVTPQTNNLEIQSRYQLLAKQFAPEILTPLYSAANQARAQRLSELLASAAKTLSDERKRQEYGEFLASAKSGRFEAQSKNVATDNAIQIAAQLLEQAKHAQAYQVLKEALNQAPRDPRLFAWTGLALYQSGNTNKGKELLTYAIKADSQCHDAHLHLAKIFIQEKNLEGAKSHLALILGFDPKNAAARKLLQGLDVGVESVSIEINAIYNHLTSLDYYALLDVGRDVDRDALQRAYHAKTKQFHPDRFFNSRDTGLKEKANTLYKRCVEAYMVLKNVAKRKEYDQQLLGASRSEQAVRLKDAGDVVQKKERTETVITSPQARKFYNLALTALQTGNFSGAALNFKLALNSEPNNETIQKRLKETELKMRS